MTRWLAAAGESQEGRIYGYLLRGIVGSERLESQDHEERETKYTKGRVERGDKCKVTGCSMPLEEGRACRHSGSAPKRTVRKSAKSSRALQRGRMDVVCTLETLPAGFSLLPSGLGVDGRSDSGVLAPEIKPVGAGEGSVALASSM